MEKIIDLMQVCEENNLHFTVTGFNHTTQPMSFMITTWIPRRDRNSVNLLSKLGMEYDRLTDDCETIIMNYKSED